ncbi:MAG: MFS transporter [Alphaproteobacteria bacterium]|nr:MFS transporter [Alphaproteobacteria bacterium]
MSAPSAGGVDSPYAWIRLIGVVAISTLGGVGMWSIVVALPTVQAEFGVARAGASFPYALTMVGFACGTVLMGGLADRFGAIVPVIGGTVAMSLGYVAAAHAPNIWLFAVIYGAVIGLGSSATFAPLVADISLWFEKRRGIAIAVAATGNYLAGTIWPGIVEHFIASSGWRETHLGIGIFCLVTILPLTFVLRRPAPTNPAPVKASRQDTAASPDPTPFLRPGLLQGLLALAGLSCCIAMSMPQVHLVAYCVDLGYGPARGAEMLSLMLGCGVISRLTFGVILDRAGGLRTLLIGSALQAMALALYLPFDGLVSLYVISAVFGLGQGGIVPSYAYIVRELFPAREAATRVSLTLSATLVGMALGGWMSGAIFDLTGSYQAALLNGVGWNIVNLLIAASLLRLQRRAITPLPAIT